MFDVRCSVFTSFGSRIRRFSMNSPLPTPPPLLELATFYLGQALCGLDIHSIQEVNRVTDVTRVPQAPDYVKGILNLRGQIVTVLDIAGKLGLGSTEENRHNRIVIVQDKGEAVGLLVSRMGDVMTTDRARIEPTPANTGSAQSEVFEGVIKGEEALVGILNLARVLAE
jgi:purine-binding chemotaxis protein CheW